MIKIILLILIVLVAVDGIFSDGMLLITVLRQELYIPVMLRLLYVAIAMVVAAMLFHAIIKEYGLKEKPEQKKTELQIQREREAEEAERAAEELKKYNEKKNKEKEQETEKEKAPDKPHQKKQSKLG